MGEVVRWILLLLVVGAAATAAFAAASWWRLKRRVRVSPRVPTDAPVAWLWSGSPAARMHRGLQRAAQAVRLATRPADRRAVPDHLRELAGAIEREAVELDRHLVVMNRLPKKHRKRALRELATSVAEVERLADRLARAATDATRPTPAATPAHGEPQGLAWVAERLDLLDDARQELSRLELTEGGVPPDELPLLTERAAESPVERRGPRR